LFKSLKIFFQAAKEKELLITAFKVALVVGVILNLINQGKNIVNFSNLNLTKFILTFFVPFGVSIYSSAIMRLNIQVGERAKIKAKVKCLNCKDGELKIEENQLVEECVNCGDKTKYKVIEIIK